jgi:ABC-2 type transport system permease protein
MKSVLLIARKDLVVLARDKLALFWVAGFPLVFAIFFGTVLDGAIERATGGQPPSPPSGFVRSLPTGVVWGLISSAATFAVAMVSERTRGTLHRLRAAPTSDAALLGGKALACWVACVAVASLLVAVAVALFGARIEHPFALALAVISAASGFVGITVLLGVTGKSEQSVAGAGWAVLLGFAMLGGAMIPTSLMPVWLQDLGSVSPVRWALVALETALFGGDPAELAARCLPLLALGGAGLTLASHVLRRTARA